MSVELRVASFNIRNGRAFDGWNSWPFRRRATLAAIADLRATVVGLQEVYGFQYSWLARHLPDLAGYGVGRTNGRAGERCPVFVERARGRIVDPATRWYGATPDRAGSRLEGASFPRVATIVRVELDGVTITVANTHLDEKRAANREQSVRQLLEWASPATPLVVMGDLNARPDAAALAQFDRAGLRSALAADAGGTGHDFTGRVDGPRIDHIYVSEHFDVVASRVAHGAAGARLPSDHWPIVADLRLR